MSAAWSGPLQKARHVMNDSKTEQIVREVIEAHGGMDRWSGLDALDAEISASGFLFTTKRRPVLNHVRVRAATREPRFTFFDFPLQGQTAELFGNNEVQVRDRGGTILARRNNPRAAFTGLRRQFVWDDLDFIYFAGYATWNYLTTPFLLARKGFEIETLEPLPGALSQFTRLQVIFPEDIPTHSRRQVFYIDEQRLLRRLDYTAEVVGMWAHAAHLCEDFRTFGGITAPTRRRVRPLPFGNMPLPGPVLVKLDVHDIRPVPASPADIRAA
jgi:hypothetical protein